MTSGKPVAETVADAIRAAIDLDAPLDERLGLVRDAVDRLNPVFSAGAQRMVDRLEAAGAGKDAPAVGEMMPPFLLPDQEGHFRTLAEFLTGGPVVVAFHRGHWCPYCRLHAKALGEVRRRVETFGGRILAIAPNRRRFNRILRSLGGDEMAILSDIDNAYAMSLNLAIWVGDEMRELKQAGGHMLNEYHGNEDWLLPIPATFLVAQDGQIAFRHLDPDYRRRVDVARLMDALKAIRPGASSPPRG